MFKPSGILCALALLAGLLVDPEVQGATLVATNGQWRFFRGVSDPSPGNPGGWKHLTYGDSSWETGSATFFYGEAGFSGTQLASMQNSHTTLFLRRKFTVPDPANVAELDLRVICDDGFVAYLNGSRIAELNAPAGEPVFGSTAPAAIGEPVAYATYPVAGPASVLVPGENVLAVVALNTSASSSDFIFAAELLSTEKTPAPPVIVQVDPEPGLATNLNRITVTFSEPVTGIEAGQFLVNGVPASGVAGTGATYSFTFAPPAFGTVGVTWGSLHNIRDLDQPPQRFDAGGPGAAWTYELLDPDGPGIVSRLPLPGTTLRHLAEVELRFNRPVTGLDAADLRLNGVPAAGMTGIGAGPFSFTFPAGAAEGTATLSWAAGHGILSDEPVPHAFTGGSWSYLINAAQPVPQVVINEFVAENLGGLKDEDADPEDWLELHNHGTAPVNLAGWALAAGPDREDEWVFPSVSIPARGYLLVWISGKDRRESGPLHTHFKLNPNGDTLRLLAPELPRLTVDAVEYGEQGPDYSYGRQAEGANSVWRYFGSPTPLAANGVSTITNKVADVHFSVERGYFDTPFRLSLATTTPGAVIRYSTNGVPPVGTNGFLYTQPILISANRVIRAAASLTNHLPSRLRTHTYLYNITANRRGLPALSLVSATNNLFGKTGIMESNPRNTDKHGPAWERPVSVEYIRPEDNGGFQVDAGIRIQGGAYVRGFYDYRTASLPASKYSFRLYFRGEYGQGRLEYPFFPGTTVESFDTIVLRAGMNDHSNPFVKDEFNRQLLADMGQPAAVGNFVQLFLNGVYKGYYNPTERIDVDFLRAYHGGGDRWDIIAQSGEIREGDGSAWNALMSMVQTRPATNQANYLEYTQRVDLTNFVDYLLPHLYVDADDWPHNNWRAAREAVPGGKWRFYGWDLEWSFGDPNGHTASFNSVNGAIASTSPPWGSTEIQRFYNSLKRNREFQLLFADRVHRALFNGGPLTDESLRRRYDQVKAQFNATRTVSSFNNGMINNWINNRRRAFLPHLYAAGYNRSTNAPGLNQFGGAVPAGFALTLTNVAGNIYYTTDGSDPRVPFTEGVAPAAQLYAGTPLTLTEPLRLRARSLDGTTNWSAVTEATFEIAQPGLPLAITELMYNPPGGEAYEYVELANVGGAPVELAGVSLEGVNFRFPTPFPPLPGGGRIVLANEANPALFATRYPGVPVAGYFGGSLSNGGERVALLDPDGRVIFSVTYEDDGAWPTAPDGAGSSLELGNLAGDPDAAENWHPSAAPGGTPGADNSPAPAPLVIFHEVLASLAPGADWIELHNAGASTVNLAGWSLTDAADVPRKFVFPAGSQLPAGGFLLVNCDTNIAAGGLHSGFGLDADGESLVLFNATTNRMDSFGFGPQAPGFTVGWLDSTWRLCEPTPGGVNEAAVTGPPTALAVNEFLADSEAGDDWIELHNPTELPVVLTGLHLGTSNALFQVTAPAFVGAGGFATFQADERPGGAHLDFKLPAAGGAIALFDANGTLLTKVTYAAQTPLVTTGRLPDGTGGFAPLPFSASPGASNYLAEPGATLRLNEVMAAGPGGADWIELHNPTTAPLALAGFTLQVNGDAPWSFPADAQVPVGGFLVVTAATNAAGPLNLGRELPDNGGALVLADARKRLLDRLTFGFQLPGQPAGRTPEGWRLLADATPGATNAAAAALGDSMVVRFNEWLVASTNETEWIELFNPGALPADLGGHFLSDDPSVSGLTNFALAPLSFVPAGGFVRYFADSAPEAGPDHVNFRLDQLGETIRLSTPARGLLDAVDFGVQLAEFSEGRVPDGLPRVLRLPVRSPLAPNAPPDFDFDGDGVPDGWELANGLNPDLATDGGEDADNDGCLNRDEYAAGTDPRNAASLLAASLEPLAADAVALRFTAVAGRSYRVLFADENLADAIWTQLGDVPAEGATREVTVPDLTPPEARPARFYRVVTPAAP